MAFIEFSFRSRTLQLSCQINAVFSQRIRENFGPKHRSPVLYLLHGLSDDHSAWTRRTAIESFVEAYDVVVVMPAAHRSFYANTYSGYRYFDYIADELPEICRHHFPISDAASDTHVAGFSMGGYGAFKLGLTYPERFATAASISGALDLQLLSPVRDERLPEWSSIFGPGDTFFGSQNDLTQLIKQAAADQRQLPQLFQTCGTEDHLLPLNQSFKQQCDALKIPVRYETHPGQHDWAYCNTHLQTLLEWLPLTKLEPQQS